MARDDERLMRSQEGPIVGGLPDVPGILTALRLTPELGIHLRGLAVCMQSCLALSAHGVNRLSSAVGHVQRERALARYQLQPEGAGQPYIAPMRRLRGW